MGFYKTGLEGEKGESVETVECPALGVISADWCPKCSYFQGLETLEGGRRRPDKKAVICGAPMMRVVKKIVLVSMEASTGKTAPKGFKQWLLTHFPRRSR